MAACKDCAAGSDRQAPVVLSHVDRRKIPRTLAENGVSLMGPSVRLIIELNIKHYRGLLESEKDPVKLKTIAKLLEEEKQKLADLDARPKE